MAMPSPDISADTDADPNNENDPTIPTSPEAVTTPSASICASLHAYPFDSDPAFLAGLSQIFGHPNTPATEAELSQKPDLALSAKCFYFSRKFKLPTPINAATYKTWLATSSTRPLIDSTNTTTTAITGANPRQTTPPAPSNPATQTTQPLPAQPNITATSSTSTAFPVTTASQSQLLIQTSDSATETPQQQQQQVPPPPYPTSFAAIVDLITNNKAVPGIEEVPTTVLELGSSKQDRTARRRKPWEKDASETGGGGGALGATATIVVNGDATDSDSDSERVTGTVPEEGLLRLLRPDAVPESGLVGRD